MKKYSRGKMKLKRLGFVLAILFVLMLVSGIVMLTCFCFRDDIEKVHEDTSAKNVSTDVASNSMPVVVDNLVVGALYNDRWVSATKYYTTSNLKNDLDTYVYTFNQRAGTYKIEDAYTSGDSVYVNTSYTNYIDEYFAIPQDNTYALSSRFQQVEVLEKDYIYAKKALGTLRLYNSSLNISNVYSAYINDNTPVRIIEVTSREQGLFGGVYSAVIVAFTNSNKAKIVEYNYTKDLENTDDFPLHSAILLADLNGNGNCELVTRSVTEFKVTYGIFEYKNGKFVRVLQETIKGK